MKKLAIATLIALTSLAAQAQTQLYGTISQFADKTSGRELGAVNNLSRFGIIASEKIGTTTARVQIETNLGATDPVSYGNTTRLGDRQSTVGLAGAVGSIDFGRNVHGQFLAVTMHDPFATAYASVAGDHHNLRGLRMSNAAFVSFTPVKALTVQVDRELGNDNSRLDQATSVAVFANTKQASVAVAHYEQGTSRSDVAAATVSVATAKLHGIYSRSSDGGVETVAKTVGASLAVSAPVTLKTSYSETDRGAQAWNLGADYALSKRTALHAAFKRDSVRDVNSVGLGITHSF